MSINITWTQPASLTLSTDQITAREEADSPWSVYSQCPRENMCDSLLASLYPLPHSRHSADVNLPVSGGNNHNSHLPASLRQGPGLQMGIQCKWEEVCVYTIHHRLPCLPMHWPRGLQSAPNTNLAWISRHVAWFNHHTTASLGTDIFPRNGCSSCQQ